MFIFQMTFVYRYLWSPFCYEIVINVVSERKANGDWSNWKFFSLLARKQLCIIIIIIIIRFPFT